MFKNLLDPNSEKALSKALETLDQNVADQRQALVHLIISNQEKLSASPLIDQIKELLTLFELFKQAEPEFKQRIETLLTQSLSSEYLATQPAENTKAVELLSKAINANQQDTLYTIAALSNCLSLTEPALTKIPQSKQEQLLKEAKNENTQTLIIKNITQLETLKRLEKEHKGKDKKIYRQLQERIETLELVVNQKNLLIEKSHKIIDNITKLSQSTYVPLYESKFQHIETEWKDLLNELDHSSFSNNEIIDETTRQTFEKAGNKCKKIINEVVALEQKEHEKLQSQAFLEKSLKNLHAFLSADILDIDACKQLISSINEKLALLSTENINFDKKYFEELNAAYNFHQELMTNQLQELETINQQLIELTQLFSTNHKKKKAEQATLTQINTQIDKLNALQKKLPPINENLDFDIQGLKLFKEKINAASSLKKQCLDMQNEFQGKFEKKLGYIKAELENKALNTVKRLCKEAEELLPLCPVKQQEKLQKRLDGYKEDVAKLEDWFNFATLPKRKELCAQMDELAKNSSRTKIKILKEEIKKLQQSWKDLGHARDSEGEALWKHFQEAGDLAYQPIKDLLERKDQEKQKNLEIREDILQKLILHIEQNFPEYNPEISATVEKNKTQKLDTQSSEKLLRQSQISWTKAFPIPPGHQNLQKQFDERIKQLDEKLKPARNVNLGKKNILITQAEKLLELENINEAIESAKKLQQEWKDIGYCDNDEELWKKFRAICDKVFEARDSLRDEQKDKEHKSMSEAKTICRAIDSIATGSSDSNITQLESELRRLCSQFEELKNLPKQRKDIQSNFLKAKKSARHRLEQLKQSSKSEAFQSIITICKTLGNLEKDIINKSINNSDDIIQKSEAIFAEFNCPSDSKEPLKNSLLNLFEASHDNLDAYIAQQVNQLRPLCIELEIELEIDSPPSDKGLRMELQVKRLNKRFNQNEQEASISDKILSAFYLGGLYSFQDESYVNRLIKMQTKVFSEN